MNRSTILLRAVTAGLAASLFAAPAFAHTGAGPVAGLASGLVHPLIGLDHLLAMVAVGLLAARLGGRALWAVPASFLVAMIAASAIAMAGLALPLVELGIVASVVILGAAIALNQRIPTGIAMALAGVFALFHGHAHGAEMPLAASAIGYGAGFVLTTLMLHGTGIAAGLATRRAGERLASTGLRLGGGAIVLAGLAYAAI